MNAPENVIAEVIFGELHTQPRPAMPQAIARSTLLGELYGPFCRAQGGPGGWSILFSPELHLGGDPDIVVPDLAGWTRARDMMDDEAPIAVAPDWICEVLSPSTQAIDRTDKMQIYRREQVRHVWLIDPIALTLEVYRHGGDVWHQLAVHRDEAVVRAEPFDAFELQLARLWDL